MRLCNSHLPNRTMSPLASWAGTRGGLCGQGGFCRSWSVPEQCVGFKNESEHSHIERAIRVKMISLASGNECSLGSRSPQCTHRVLVGPFMPSPDEVCLASGEAGADTGSKLDL